MGEHCRHCHALQMGDVLKICLRSLHRFLSYLGFSASILLIALSAPSLEGQVQSQPANPDNILTPTDPLGTPPGVATDGTGESVNLSNGALTVYIPLISIPQRGGWSLPLAYVHSSSNVHLRQTVANTPTWPTDGSNFYTDKLDFSTGMIQIEPAFDINLPRLQATKEYAGDYVWKFDNGQAYAIMGRYCITNFQFTDWEGSTHPFAITLSCNQPIGVGAPMVPSKIADATDGSFYRIDLTNVADTKIISKSGTVYHFSNLYDPYPTPPGDGSNGNYISGTDNNSGIPFYNNRFSSMTDNNGNTITLTGGSTLTDTIGRKFNISDTGVTYTDNNSTVHPVATFTMTHTGHSISDALPIVCTYKTGDPNPGYPYTSGTCTEVRYLSYPSYSASIAYPAADASGTARVINFDLDSAQRITKIYYPAGGYTRYDYGNFNVNSYSSLTTTIYPMMQVADKYECPSSTGACSVENKTTYAPTLNVQNDVTGPFNSSIKVTDPLGNITVHNFGAIRAQQVAPKETDVYKYNANNTLMWHQNTTYTTLGSFTIPTDLFFPYVVSTSVYSNSGTSPITSSTTYTYATYPALIAPNSYPATASNVYIDNPTETDEADYGGTLKKKTAQTWSTLNTFSGSSGHILDRTLTKTVTDQVKSLQNATAFVYDLGSNTVGNLTKKTVTSANATTAVTQYARNTYGQVTQVTDPRTFITTLGYGDTNAWADSSCAPPASSSAYATSKTDALSHVTTYKYNSCLGTIASITGPNAGETSNYTYDALQRLVSATFPDGGGQKACYFDSIPNTITTYTLKSVGSSLPACSSPNTAVTGNTATAAVMDGVGRKLQTQALSDPSGVVNVDTSYDADGNVLTTSNPYRSSDATYGTTSYQYDGLNRKTQATYPDGSIDSWSFSTNVATFTDGNGSVWQRTSDAFGNLTSVSEPNGTAKTASMITDYTYDGLGNLWNVTQWGGPRNSTGARTRSFTYNGISQLLTSTNPETGALCYGTWSGASCIGGYDANGNVLFKTDARSVTTAFSYDKINRVLSKTYTNDASGTPFSCYQYDLSGIANSIGRLTNQWTQTASLGACGTTPPATGKWSKRAILAYDAMGRVTSEQQCTPFNCNTGTPYKPVYSYDLAGNTLTASNGITNTPTVSTLSLTNKFDDAGHLLTVSSNWNDATHPATLFSAQAALSQARQCPGSLATAPYAAFGGLLNATFGSGLTLSRTYDIRLRASCEIDSGTTGP